jgi:hypothetical protein
VKPRLIGDKDRLILKEDVARLTEFVSAAAEAGVPRPTWAPDSAHGPWFHFWRQSELVVRILFQSGLRRAELANLKVRDCDTATAPQRLLVRGGKKRRADEVDAVRIPAGLAQEIDRWIARHELNPDDPLLPSARGRHLSVRWIYQLAKEPILAIGLNPKFATHHYRHRYATSLYQSTDDLLVVQKQLRHRSLQPTATYLHLANAEEVMADAMDGISLDDVPPPKQRRKKKDRTALHLKMDEDRRHGTRRT